MTQQHAPAGSAQGGQFMPQVSGETSESVMTSLDAGDGTFDYPPTFRTYQQMKDFLLRAPIPEDTMRAFDDAMSDHWTAERAAVLDRWVEQEKPRRMRGNDEKVWEAQLAQKTEEVNGGWRNMTPQRSRSLLRLRRMAENSYNLDEQERARFWADRFTIPSFRPGEEEVGTARQHYDLYHVDRVDPNAYRRSSQQDMGELVRTVRAMRTAQYLENNMGRQ